MEDGERKIQPINKKWLVLSIINLVIFAIAVPYAAVRATYVIYNDLEFYIFEYLLFYVYLGFSIVINIIFKVSYGRFFNYFVEIKRYLVYKNGK